ncbi:hypothetical protein SUGI_0657380 [Cryptomeria japonica]|nr:hypothetical protein SUGI_0657380 [Cryptomeria japonica]
MEKKSFFQWILLLSSFGALTIGVTAGPLLMKFYYHNGGKQTWFPAWIETAGWPILFLPIWFSSAYNKNHGQTWTKHICPKLVLASIGIGLLTGLDNFMYSKGLCYLPLSTAALLIAAQLAFNGLFSFLLVRQKFTPYSINAVILLTLATITLSFNSSNDRPSQVTHANYVLGFIMLLGSAAFYGLILPLIELMYKATDSEISYTLVMEMQLIMGFSATVFTTVGMGAHRSFHAIIVESKISKSGEVWYFVALITNGLCWQLFYIGVFGVIFLMDSLFSGIMTAISVPVNQVLAVILFHEKFTGVKGISVAVALWGFISYLYGEYRYFRKLEQSPSLDIP